MLNEVNFLSPKVSDKDRDSFGFDDENIMIEDHWIMAHVMHAAGIFPSVGIARKNGSVSYTHLTLPTNREV